MKKSKRRKNTCPNRSNHNCSKCPVCGHEEHEESLNGGYCVICHQALDGDNAVDPDEGEDYGHDTGRIIRKQIEDEDA